MRRSILFQIGLVLICIFSWRSYSFAEEITEEAQYLTDNMITIYEVEGVTPEVLMVEPGTTVNWFNCTGEEVEIIFLDEEVIDAVDCSEYFYVNKEGIYQSLVMGCEYVSSLCFQESGFFDYVVKVYKLSYGAECEYRGAIFVH
jgi:hypothetical protein